MSIIASSESTRIYIEDSPNEDRSTEDSEIDDCPIQNLINLPTQELDDVFDSRSGCLLIKNYVQ